MTNGVQSLVTRPANLLAGLFVRFLPAPLSFLPIPVEIPLLEKELAVIHLLPLHEGKEAFKKKTEDRNNTKKNNDIFHDKHLP